MFVSDDITSQGFFCLNIGQIQLRHHLYSKTREFTNLKFMSLYRNKSAYASDIFYGTSKVFSIFLRLIQNENNCPDFLQEYTRTMLTKCYHWVVAISPKFAVTRICF